MMMTLTFLSILRCLIVIVLAKISPTSGFAAPNLSDETTLSSSSIIPRPGVFHTTAFAIVSTSPYLLSNPAYATNSKLKKSSPSLEEARDQLDLVVQACSVQAWGEAYELLVDPVLSDIDQLLLTTPHKGEEEERITNGIRQLRDRLKGVSSLPTEDAMSVMSIGTSTRTALEQFLASNS